MPDVLVDAEGGHVLEPGLVGRQLDELGFDSPPHRLPRCPELTGKAMNGRVLTTELRDRPADGALSNRPAPSDQTWHLFHERPPRTTTVAASPDPLPPDDPHSRRPRNVMQHPAPAPATDHHDPARGTSRRRRRARDRHNQHPVATLNMLDMDTIDTEQQIAAGTRAEGRARVSAPRSRVKHVEVLVIDQRVSASDPRGPRPLPAHHHPGEPHPTECPKSRICDHRLSVVSGGQISSCGAVTWNLAHSLNAYGRTGQPCPRCGRPIVRVSFMNRSRHLCPHSQKRR